MKKKYLIVIIIGIVVILGILLFFVLDSRKNIEITEIKSLEFGHHPGWGPNATYEIVCEDKCYASIDKWDPKGSINRKEITIDDDIMQELIAGLNKHKVSRWNGYNRISKNVYDALSFNLFIKIQDDKDISARGYAYCPRNYDEVKEFLDKIFAKINENY